MTGFLGKLFGGKKKEDKNSASGLMEDTLQQLIELSGLELEYQVELNSETEEIMVELSGEDEEMLRAKEGQLLDSFQVYLKRVLIHNYPDSNHNVAVDSNGFREESNQTLIDLAEKLKGIAVSKGKPVYFRALPPRERKVIHQYLANDSRVRSRSIGEGLYKKIKIYPVKEDLGAEVES